MRRRTFHKSLGSLVDNTFRQDRPHMMLRGYHRDFAKHEQTQRLYQEFEMGHMKRLLRRQQECSGRLSYMPGQSMSNYRPRTGVDAALGLNGCRDLDQPHAARTPSTLLPLQDDALAGKNRPMSDCEKDEKWREIRNEVEGRRRKEEQEERNLVLEAERMKLSAESENLSREERSRQLERSAAEDWKYQVEFKNRIKTGDSTARVQDCYDLGKKVQEAEYLEEEKKIQKEVRWQEEKRLDLENFERKQAMEDMEVFDQHQLELVETSRKKVEEERDKAREIQKAKELSVKVKQVQSGQIHRNALQEAVARSRKRIEEGSKLADCQKIVKMQRNAEIEDKKSTAKSDDEFKLHLKDSDKIIRTERNFTTKYIEENSHEIMQANYERIRQEELARKHRRLQLNNFVVGQIQDRQDLVKREMEEKSAEMARRIEEEAAYKNWLQSERERRRREQDMYRIYLEGQKVEVEERRKIK